MSTDVALARRLVAAQFPEWAALGIGPVRSSGTDNALYRAGRGVPLTTRDDETRDALAALEGVIDTEAASDAWVDDATWARDRGWALSIALIALPYYIDTNPAFADVARHLIGEVLAEG